LPRKALMGRSFRVTEAFAVAAVELAGALFVNWIRLAGLAIGIRAPARIGGSGKIEGQPSCLGSMGGYAMPYREERIRETAYFLWESEGRPDGRAELHWTTAEAIVDAEDANAPEKVVELSQREEVSQAEFHAAA
jgi:hypothetical protein